MVKNIKDIPLSDRPYEKLEQIGESNLTNSELLAIIIKTGTKRLNCLEIAQNILKGNSNSKINDLEYLTNLSNSQLMEFEGIGRIKAIEIRAVIELSKRISKTYKKDKYKITSPSDVFNMLAKEYVGKKQECLKTIILNKQNYVIDVITNAIGNNDSINIGIKEVFSEPIKDLASSIILVHNHPGGSLIPSKSDILFTEKINKYSKIFNIELLDHIIITNTSYASLKQMEKI